MTGAIRPGFEYDLTTLAGACGSRNVTMQFHQSCLSWKLQPARTLPVSSSSQGKINFFPNEHCLRIVSLFSIIIKCTDLYKLPPHLQSGSILICLCLSSLPLFPSSVLGAISGGNYKLPNINRGAVAVLGKKIMWYYWNQKWQDHTQSCLGASRAIDRVA